MVESIAVIALVGALSGAVANTVRAYLEAPASEGYSVKKLLGAIIGSGLFGLSVVNFNILPETVSSVGLVGLFVLNALAGAMVSTTVHKLHK